MNAYPIVASIPWQRFAAGDVLQALDDAEAELPHLAGSHSDLFFPAAVQAGRLAAVGYFLGAINSARAERCCERLHEAAMESSVPLQLAVAHDVSALSTYYQVMTSGSTDFSAVSDQLAIASSLMPNERPERGEVLFHLGLVAERKERLPEAVDHFRQALRHAQSRAMPLLESYAIRHLGFEARRLGRLDAAKQAFETSLAIRLAVRAKPYLPLSHTVLADLLLELAEPLEAYEQASRALELAHAMRLPTAQVFANLSCYRCAVALRRRNDAERHLAAASQVAQNLGYDRWLRLVEQAAQVGA
jgi:tetratricopeptide (TPR) repeat protein